MRRSLFAQHRDTWRRRLLRPFAAALALAILAGAAPAQKKTPPSTPVDLNVANVKELEEIPGIGPVTAQAIIQFRQKSGPFKRVEDLLVIRGISQRKLKEIRPYVVVKSVAPAKPAAKPPAPAAPAGSAPQKKP